MNLIPQVVKINNLIERKRFLEGLMVSIKDVARFANVSISTVSRVINGSANVDEKLRMRVLDAVEKLGYRTNPFARGLKGFPTHTIGLIIPDIENPFFPGMVRGVQDVAIVNGYTIFLCNTDGDMKLEEAQYKMLLEKKVDGILVVTSDMKMSYIDPADKTPVVLIDRYIGSENFSYVIVDHAIGMRLALDHLREIGRKDPIFLGSKPITSSARERFQAFLNYHKSYPKIKSRILLGKYTEESGAGMAERMLERGVRFDSVVCGNDLIAYGVIEILEKRGIKVPGDVSVIGYDDIPFSAHRFPKLTSVHQPIYELGEISAHLLIDGIRKHSEPKHIRLEPRLVVRETSFPKRECEDVDSQSWRCQQIFFRS